MKNSKNLPWTIDEASIKEVIRESLNPGKDQKKEVANLAEAYVVSASKYDISTEKLSEENKSAHQELMQSYA